MAEPASRRQILIATASAVAVGAVLLVGAVLPAEYGIDPLGIGRATGIAAIWAPPEQVVAPSAQEAPSQRIYASAWRSDVIDIPIDTYESGKVSELEYKVRLRKGATLIYSWEAIGRTDPEELYTEFHGHTIAAGKPMTVAYYRKAMGVRDNGALTAPFDGVHGWFFQNQAVVPIRVRLRLSGFYDLVPPGAAGNEAGFLPVG